MADDDERPDWEGEAGDDVLVDGEEVDEDESSLEGYEGAKPSGKCPKCLKGKLVNRYDASGEWEEAECDNDSCGYVVN